MTDPVLQVRKVSKTFGPQRVLRSVDLEVAAGEIHALVGENGSGKSTLVKILSGFHHPDPGGEVLVAGQPLLLGRSGAADAAGLRFLHQDLGLAPTMDAVDNLALGNGYETRRGRPIHWRARRRDAREVLEALGYQVDVQVPVERLSQSERTAVAIARAVERGRGQGSCLLVLDEPTANLAGPEVARLFGMLRRLRDSGIAVLFISHRLQEVREIANRVTVLRDGEVVRTCPVTEVDEDELIELMVGRPVQRSLAGSRPTSQEVVLELRAVGGKRLALCDLEVGRGEVVGVAGITGSGREELASLIFGGAARLGQVLVHGKEVPPERPERAMAAGMVLVPAERNARAAFLDHDVRENLTMGNLRAYMIAGRLRRSRERSDVERWLSLLDVRPRNPGAEMRSLSGGNAQKVILARAMLLKPTILVLDEPTQGVDVGAKEEIHLQIERIATEGTGILVCSSESEELARLCHRVAVLVSGRIESELHAPVDADQLTTETLRAAKTAA